MERPCGTAKLIIWHGAPGTGKTTALRSLLRSWQSWCRAHYVADPERLFAHPGYLHDVVAGSVDRPHRRSVTDDASTADFELIIAEDCDGFLRSDARRDAGTSLGRLLNLGDGILGQGFDTLVLLTTNAPIQRLDPALVRPGRCLASVEFEMFSPAAAQRWLGGRDQAFDDPVTLAQLFKRRGDFQPVIGASNPARQIGQYL